MSSNLINFISNLGYTQFSTSTSSTTNDVETTYKKFIEYPNTKNYNWYTYVITTLNNSTILDYYILTPEIRTEADIKLVKQHLAQLEYDINLLKEVNK